MWVTPEGDLLATDSLEGNGTFSPGHGRQLNSANNFSGQGLWILSGALEGMLLCPHRDFS